LVQLFDVPLMPVVGAVLSMLTAGLLVAVVELPALSLTDLVSVSSWPSLLIVLSAGQVPAMPDPPALSLQVQWIATLSLCQPFAFGGLVGDPDKVGGVVSPAGAVDDAVLVLPALSVAVPVTVTPG